MASEGVNQLAQILDGRMKQLDASPPLLDFGVIKGNSLLTNTFPIPIPNGDYVVCSSVKDSDNKQVLVAWVRETAVVIDTIG